MSTKHKKFNMKDHPFLKEAQQHNEAKLSEFLERINGSKLTTEEKKVKKDIEQSKATFVKIDKGVEIRVHDQPRKFLPKIVDLNETKKQKKAEKIVRKEADKQQSAAAASGVSAAPDRVQRQPQKERFKDKHLRKLKEYRDEVDEERLDDYYDDDQDYEDDDLDPEARKQLDGMLGRYRSSTYRDRDREEIIESKPGDIEREENYSKLMAMKEDMEQQRILREQRERKKRKKMRRLEQVEEEERSYSDDD